MSSGKKYFSKLLVLMAISAAGLWVSQDMTLLEIVAASFLIATPANLVLHYAVKRLR